jgi:DNA adenine methylase
MPNNEPTVKGSWPLVRLIDGVPHWHIEGTHPPQYARDEALERVWRERQNMTVDTLKAPFPYFGGKSRIAGEVWARFGAVANYVEPFFGSGAVLLSCPTPGHTETVNDADGLLANFWRALQAAPDAVAQYADYPVSELDLHARHRWLVNQRADVERLLSDPEWFDAKAAGWWVWGISQWIGTGWCPQSPAGTADVGELTRKLPHVGDAGRGVHRATNAHAGGMAVRAPGRAAVAAKLWQLPTELGGDSGATGRAYCHPARMGVRRTMNAPAGIADVGELPRQLPHVGSAGRGLRTPARTDPLRDAPDPPACRLRVEPLRVAQ